MVDFRQTGRTTRMLLKAILAASEGDDVIVVGRTMEQAAWLREKALNMSDGAAKKVNASCVEIGISRMIFTNPRILDDPIKPGVKIFRDNY